MTPLFDTKCDRHVYVGKRFADTALSYLLSLRVTFVTILHLESEGEGEHMSKSESKNALGQ